MFYCKETRVAVFSVVVLCGWLNRKKKAKPEVYPSSDELCVAGRFAYYPIPIPFALFLVSIFLTTTL